MLFDDSFTAMGTRVDVLVDAHEPPIAAFLSVRLLFADQEARFSRFRGDSLLARLNSGEAVSDPQFVEVCRLAVEAHEFTGGLFNPFILQALCDAGYDRSFGPGLTGAARRQRVPAPGECLDFGAHGVRLRSAKARLDLGGIVKGWTADQAVSLLAASHANAYVNAGGDVRAAGHEPGRSGWLTVVDSGEPGQPLWEGDIQGALATSSTARRQWTGADGRLAHHVIDPRTGLPSDSGFRQVSVWGESAWRAECWAKAILVGGEQTAERCRAAGNTVLAV